MSLGPYFPLTHFYRAREAHPTITLSLIVHDNKYIKRRKASLTVAEGWTRQQLTVTRKVWISKSPSYKFVDKERENGDCL